MGGKGPWGATSLHPGWEWACESRSAGAGKWVGRREGGRGRKEVSLEDATAGGGAGPGIRRRDCSSAWWGRGLQCHSFWGQVRVS